jgi:hypothetical protein
MRGPGSLPRVMPPGRRIRDARLEQYSSRRPRRDRGACDHACRRSRSVGWILALGQRRGSDALDVVAGVEFSTRPAVSLMRDGKMSAGPDRPEGRWCARGHLGLLARCVWPVRRGAAGVQRLAGQRFDLASKTGAQAVAWRTRDVNRLDDRPVPGLGPLLARARSRAHTGRG